MKLKSVVHSTALVAFSAVIWSAAYSAPVLAQTKLTGNAFFPRHHPFMTGVLGPWSKGVEKVSKGRVTVVIPPASLAPAPRQWDMVAKRIADVAVFATTFQRKRLHMQQISKIPFLTTTAEATSVALWRTRQKFFKPADEFKGMKLLASFVHTGYILKNSKRPITKVADLKGLKIRSSPGSTKALLDKLGASVVTSPGVKIFEYVSKGTVDGLIATYSSIRTYRIGRYIKYVTEFPGQLSNVSFSFMMNQKVWDGLPAQDKKAIGGISHEVLSRGGGKAWDDAQGGGFDDVKKYNIKIVKADDSFMAELRRKSTFIQDQWMAEAKKRGLADPAAAVAFYRSEAKNLAREYAK